MNCVTRTITSLALTSLTTTLAFADTIRVGSWNIEWLDDQSSRHQSMRSSADYAKLAETFSQTGIEVLSFQEVGSEEALRKVVGDDYAIEMSGRAVTYNQHQNTELWRQYTGFVIADGIDYVRNEDLDLDVENRNRMRHAVDITIKNDGEDYIRLLSVHLKSSCFSQPREKCQVLDKQSKILAEWVSEREKEGVAYAIVGDFNRRMTSNRNPWFLDTLKQGKYNLKSASGVAKSQCWSKVYNRKTGSSRITQYPDYIDHIVTGEHASNLIVEGSFKQTTPSYVNTTKYKLSDHCPIGVDFRI